MSTFSPWEMIDDGSFNGVKKFIRSNDDDEGTVQVRYDGYDVPLITDSNKRAQNDWDGKFEDGLQKAASIPASVLMQWIAQDGHKAVMLDPDYLVRKLNDPDWRYLKRLPITL
jgi:hypothetical protein